MFSKINKFNALQGNIVVDLAQFTIVRGTIGVLFHQEFTLSF